MFRIGTYMIYKLVCGVVDFFFCGESADSKADGGVRQVDVRADRAQNVRGLQSRRSARRPATQSDTFSGLINFQP